MGETVVVVVILVASVIAREPKSNKVVLAIISGFLEYDEYQLSMTDMYTEGTRERHGDVVFEYAKESVFEVMMCLFVSEITTNGKTLK